MGAAFAAKFISFATKASDQVATTPILDSIVTGWWFRDHCKEIVPLRLNWNSAGSYRRHSACMANGQKSSALNPPGRTAHFRST